MSNISAGRSLAIHVPNLTTKDILRLLERRELQLSIPGSPSAVSDKGTLQPRIPSSNSLTLKLPEYKAHKEILSALVSSWQELGLVSVECPAEGGINSIRNAESV